MKSSVRIDPDIIIPANLATNGSFQIDQRGIFSLAWTAANVSDYVADCWKVVIQGIDTAEIVTDGSRLRIRGNGTTGQYIIIENKDRGQLGRVNESFGNTDLTASIQAQMITTAPSVPLEIQVQPRYNTSGDSWLYTYDPILEYDSGNDTLVHPVRIINTRTTSFDVGGKIRVMLQEDGDFYVILESYKELAGEYRSPPVYNPVNYTEDLIRCQAYYQKGSTYGSFPIFRNTATGLRSYIPVQFATQMASNPTMSGQINYCGLFRDASTTGNTASDQANWTSISWYTSGTQGYNFSQATITRNAYVADRQSISCSLQWYAEII